MAMGNFFYTHLQVITVVQLMTLVRRLQRLNSIICTVCRYWHQTRLRVGCFSTLLPTSILVTLLVLLYLYYFSVVTLPQIFQSGLMRTITMNNSCMQLFQICLYPGTSSSIFLWSSTCFYPCCHSTWNDSKALKDKPYTWHRKHCIWPERIGCI